jgi:Amiloride-sensitive sodium channel
LRNFFFCRFEYTQLTIYFKENHFLTSQRIEFYGMNDFLADCGGLLGLCLGVSVLSLLEILYFCTIRLGCNLQRGQITSRQDELKDGHKEAKSAVQVLKDLVTDYSLKTTIQGINYAADIERSLLERFWWFIVVIFSIFCCGSLICDIVRRYNQSPVVVSYEDVETQITEVKFCVQ